MIISLLGAVQYSIAILKYKLALKNNEEDIIQAMSREYLAISTEILFYQTLQILICPTQVFLNPHP